MKYTLADEFLGGKYKEPLDAVGYPSTLMTLATPHQRTTIRKVAAETHAKVIIQIKKAHRYVLSDDFLIAAAKIAQQSTPEVIEKMLQTARPPFGALWIEHKDIENFDSDPVILSDGRVGFLFSSLEEINPGYNASAVMIFSGAPKGETPPVMTPFGIIYSPTKSVRPGDMKQVTRDRWERLAGVNTEIAYHGYPVQSEITVLLDGLINEDAMKAAGQRFFEAGLGNYAEAFEAYKLKTLGVMARSFKLIIAMLFMLNERPETEIVISEATKPGRTWIGSGFKPTYESRTVKLIRPAGYAERTVSVLRERASPKRWHTVQGHWCVSHKRGSHQCDHDWQPVPDTDRQACGKCGKLRWWRKQHGRGHLELGAVDKTYTVEVPKP
jgi:hypothetical protein